MHELQQTYLHMKDQIDSRFQEFITNRLTDNVFKELVFCICTPMSRAQAGDKAQRFLFDSGLDLTEENREKMEQILASAGVRFKKNKVSYIIEANKKWNNPQFIETIKDMLHCDNPEWYEVGEVTTRNWLAENVKGIGMKEATHFLRNIGFASYTCILDRHILRQLQHYDVISEPAKFDKKAYLIIEKQMVKFAHELDIPVFALDFVFWANTHNGEIFK